MTSAQLYTIIALCVYAVLMALIGCISYGKSKTLDGFLIGGRNIGAWVTAFAYGTTYFSAVVFVGYAGQHGWNIGIGSIWIGIGNAVLGCLLTMALHGFGFSWRWLPWMTGVVYAVLDEWHQSYSPGRVCDPADVLIDACGVLCGVFLTHWMFKTWRKKHVYHQ